MSREIRKKERRKEADSNGGENVMIDTSWMQHRLGSRV